MTLPEVQLWQVLRGSAMNGIRFRRQHPIGVYVLDFYAPSDNWRSKSTARRTTSLASCAAMSRETHGFLRKAFGSCDSPRSTY